MKRIFPQFSALNLISISIDQRWVRLALVKSSGGKREVRGSASFESKGLSDDDLAKKIGACLQQFGVAKATVVLTVPSSLLITKNIEVPSTDRQEISEIVALQASRHTPYSKEEIIVDHLELGTFKKNYTKILLLIITANAVKKPLLQAEKSGVRVAHVLFALEGIAALVGKALKLENSGPSAIVHLDSDATDFAVIFRNRPLFQRSIPIGRQQITADAEKARPKFTEEVRKSLEAYQAENIEKLPGQVIVTGAVQNVEGVDTLLSEALRMPVRMVPYENMVPRLPSVQFAPELSFLGVIAPLALFPETKVDLIPQEIKLRKALRQRSLELLTTGVLLLILMVLGSVLASGAVYFRNARLSQLKEQFRSIARQADELETAFRKTVIIRNFLVSRGLALKVLSEVHALTPESLYLTELRFEREGKCSIKGTAENNSSVFSFIDSLEKSKYFTGVKTKGNTKRQEAKKDVIDFEIVCEIDKESL